MITTKFNPVIVLFTAHLMLGISTSAQPISYTADVFGPFAGPAIIATVDGTNTDARFYFPQGAALDSSGNLYVTESSSIRKITPTGAVTTIAGAPGFFGTNDGTTTDARFNTPVGVVIDSSNNLFIADSLNNSIRKIDTNGAVTTFAGHPQSSPFFQNGTGTNAHFWSPMGMAIDPANTIYVADQNNNCIRTITPDATVTTLAGSAFSPGSTDGPLSSAKFSSPAGIAVGSNLVFVADTANNTIRKIALNSSTVSTLAGLAGTIGSTDATGTAARFHSPYALAVDKSTNVFVAEYGNSLIRKITVAGVVTTIAGSTGVVGAVDGPTNIALFNLPTGIAVNSLGALFLVEFGNCDIRTIASGTVSTFAGLPGVMFTGTNDGPASTARFWRPWGIAASPSRNVYVSDTGNNTIRKIAPDATVTTFAGTAGVSGGTDGTNSTASFRNPYGLAVDSAENIYVADHGNNTIRKISSDGIVTTLAGKAGFSGSTDGTNSTARFIFPTGIALDLSNNIYVADSGNNTIRKITPDGLVITIAGKAGQFGSTDGTSTNARFWSPWSVAVDSTFNVYVADRINFAIRKITPDGTVTTFAGLMGAGGFIDGVSTNARFGDVAGIAIDTSGNLYVCDNYPNSIIRKVTPDAVVTTVGGLGSTTFGTDNGAAASARFNQPFALAVDPSGTLYVADSNNHAIRRGVPLALQLAAQPTTVTISWPIGSGYLLEQSSPLGQNWSPVVDAAQTNGSTISVSQATADQTYYRLRSP